MWHALFCLAVAWIASCSIVSASCSCPALKNRGLRGFKGIDGDPGSGVGGLIPFASGRATPLSETFAPGVANRYFFLGFAETQETLIVSMNALTWSRNALNVPFDLILRDFYVTVSMFATADAPNPLTFQFDVVTGSATSTSLAVGSLDATVIFPTVTTATQVATASSLGVPQPLLAGDRFAIRLLVTNSNVGAVSTIFSVNGGLAY